LISSSGTLASANTMRFSTKPAIFSSSGAWGFYYYGYRFYDPVNQRWLNRDPIGERGGYNLQGILGNRPLASIDKHGLTGWALYPPQMYWDPGVRRIYNNPEFQKGVENGARCCPKSVGVCYGGDASIGWALSAHAEASLGIGLFSGNGVDGFLSHGESVGPFGLCSPQNTGEWSVAQANPVFGAFVGCGPGAWLSNAATASDLSKTTHTFSFNIALGPLNGGIQLSFGGGIYQLVVSPPIPGTGGGLGLSCSLQKTTTYPWRPID
jgi:RHS repeat-associated protein